MVCKSANIAGKVGWSVMADQRLWGRGGAGAVTIAAVLAACAWLGTATASAKTINVSERASLTLVRKNGSVIYQRGNATGTLSGPVQTSLRVTLTSVSGYFTILVRGKGSLTFSVSGRPTSYRTLARFTANLRVVSGTGTYRRASGTGTASGIVNRRTWAASVSATGRLSY
jgi:hypothetical protein